jgi:hypothetical protein
MDERKQPPVAEVACHILGELWSDYWRGVRTIERDEVIAAYASHVPEYVAQQAIDQLIDDGVVRDDHEGLHGWPPGCISTVNTPDVIREYIEGRAPEHLPWELRDE